MSITNNPEKQDMLEILCPAARHSSSATYCEECYQRHGGCRIAQKVDALYEQNYRKVPEQAIVLTPQQIHNQAPLTDEVTIAFFVSHNGQIRRQLIEDLIENLHQARLDTEAELKVREYLKSRAEYFGIGE